MARLDILSVALPEALRSVPLHALPALLMLPARAKDPPLPLFSGPAKPPDLMRFVATHAHAPMVLPPNPHLSREQHAEWKAPSLLC